MNRIHWRPVFQAILGLLVSILLVGEAAGQTRTFTVSVSAASIAENGGTSTFTVAVNTAFATDQTFVLDYNEGTASTSGTSAGGDFRLASTSLTLRAGETSVSTTVFAIDDRNDDDDETILISAIHNGSVVGTRQTITIIDDDEPPLLAVSLSHTYLIEGVDDGLTLTLRYSNNTVFETRGTVVITLSGTATNKEDYEEPEELEFDFRSSDTEKTVFLALIDDMMDEGTETIIIEVGQEDVANDVKTTLGTWTVKIGPRVVFSLLEESDRTLLENGDENEHSLLVLRSDGPVDEEQRVTLTFGGTATKGEDYRTGSTLSISVGGIGVGRNLTPLDDDLVEGDETIEITASHYGRDIGTETITIIDDESMDATTPPLSGATVTGSTLVLTYGEMLDGASVPDPGDFVVMADGSAITVNGVSITGSTVTLTLATAVEAGQTVTLAYTPGANPIQDAAGNDAAALSGQTVTNNTGGTTNVTPPAITGAAVNGSTLILTYDEALDGASVPDPGDFVVTAAGSTIEVNRVSVAGSTVTLTLATAVEAGQTVTLAYTPGANPIQDAAGNDAALLSRQTVTNNTGGTTDVTPPPTGGGGGSGGGGGGTRGPSQTVPGAPTNLLADGGDEQVTLSWQAPENDGGLAITDYQYRIDQTGEWISIGSTQTTHTVTGLVNGTEYAFEVRAVTAAGSSAPSNRVEATPRAAVTLLVANFMNGNNGAFNSRVYLWNPSASAGQVTARVFTLPLTTGIARELTGTPLDLGTLEARSALNLKLVEDILDPLGIALPYTTDGGNLTLEFTIQAVDVHGVAQVFSSDFAFGTYPMQEIPSTSSGSPTVLVANFTNGNNGALHSRVYLWNPSATDGRVTARVFTLPNTGDSMRLLTVPLGILKAFSARNIRIAEDILDFFSGIALPYTDDGGNLMLEFTIEAPDVKGAAQVFSSDFAFGTYPMQEIPSTSSGSPTVLVANFTNGNNGALHSRVYLWNPSASAGEVTVRVFTLPQTGDSSLLGTLDLGSLQAESARNLKLAEDILTPLRIALPYVTDGGNLTLEFTIQAADARGVAQVFSSDFAFGTYPMQEIPSTSSGSPTVLVANFVNGNDAALNSRVYLWNPSLSAGSVTVRVFTLPLTAEVAQELTTAPLDLGTLGAESARNIKLAEDILTPLGIPTPYVTDGGNLTLEFTIQAADVRGAAQVFSSSFAFGTVPLQVIR